MKHSNPAPHQPTHDEIALHAYLIWEKEGCLPGHEQACWLQAEAQLRLTRQQQAELAASQSTRPWPPAAPAAAKLATARTAKPAIAKTNRLAPAFAAKPVAVTQPARKAAGSANARKALAWN